MDGGKVHRHSDHVGGGRKELTCVDHRRQFVLASHTSDSLTVGAMFRSQQSLIQ